MDGKLPKVGPVDRRGQSVLGGTIGDCRSAICELGARLVWSPRCFGGVHALDEDRDQLAALALEPVIVDSHHAPRRSSQPGTSQTARVIGRREPRPCRAACASQLCTPPWRSQGDGLAHPGSEPGRHGRLRLWQSQICHRKSAIADRSRASHNPFPARRSAYATWSYALFCVAFGLLILI